MRIERFEKGILERSLSWFKMMSFGEDLVMVASAGMMPSLGSWLTLPGKFVWPHTVALDLNTVALDSPLQGSEGPERLQAPEGVSASWTGIAAGMTPTWVHSHSCGTKQAELPAGALLETLGSLGLLGLAPRPGHAKSRAGHGWVVVSAAGA